MQSFFRTIDITDILVAMVTWLPWQPHCYVSNCFVLSPTEDIFGMKLS